MRIPLLIGLAVGVLNAVLQFLSLKLTLPGTTGAILYYSPMLLFFAAIYVSIRRTKELQPEKQLDFKTGLKAGVITSAIIAIVWAVGFFVGLTHYDVHADVQYLVANGQKSKIVETMNNITRQNMFDRTKFWAMPNFLTGFLVTIAATVILSRKKG